MNKQKTKYMQAGRYYSSRIPLGLNLTNPNRIMRREEYLGIPSDPSANETQSSIVHLLAGISGERDQIESFGSPSAIDLASASS